MHKMNALKAKFVSLWVDVFRSSVVDFGGICSDQSTLNHFMRQSAADGVRGIPAVGLARMASALESDRAELVYQFSEACRAMWDVLSGARVPSTFSTPRPPGWSDDNAFNNDYLSFCIRLSQFYRRDCDAHILEFNRSIDRVMVVECVDSNHALSSGLIARCVFEVLSPLEVAHGVDPGCIVYFGNLHARRMGRAFPLLIRVVDREFARIRANSDPMRTDSGFMHTVPQRLW